MADVSKTVAIIFQGQDQTGAALASVEKNLAGIGNEAGNAGAGLGKLGDEVDKLGTKGNSIDGLVTGLKALGAGIVFSAFIDANSALEKFELTMKATTGSSAAARAEFDYIKEVANRLGLEIGSTASAYANFSAAIKGTSLSGQDARIIFEAFAGSMSRLGKSSEDISGALVQLSQGISKGKFELDDLKSVAERMPGFFAAFADSLGKPTDELYRMISAGQIGAQEILKFAESLGSSSEPINTYEANLNRLKNAINDAFLAIGNAGAFDVLKTAIQAGTASIVGAQAATVLLGETLGNIAYTISSGDWSGFGARLDESLKKAADTTRAASDALLGAEASANKVGDAGAAAGEKVASGMKFSAEESFKAWKAASDEIDRSLKALGIDPKIFTDPVAEVADAFKTLANNAQATGEQIVVGLTGALRNTPQNADLSAFSAQIEAAYAAGRLSAEQYAQAVALVKVAQDGLSPSFGPVTQAAKDQADAFKKQADEAKRVEDAAAKLHLEMEKLASNERIKNIESKVKLNVAEVEAQTKRIEAAFKSIDNTVNSTESALSDLFGLFKDEGSLSWSALGDIRDQIDKENKRRDDALKLQGELTRAQIDNIRAQTQKIDRGESIIKVEGAGLQPHLEAFMWEILRAIQVKVNAQGLALLLGA